MKKVLMWFGISIVALAILALIAFDTCSVNVSNNQLAYTFDRWDGGKVEVVNHKGYVFEIPFVLDVYVIDLSPMQLCLNANNRVLNCKLVQFDPAGLDLFLSLHGVGQYSGRSKAAFEEIMKSYAFETTGTTYPFLKELPSSQLGKAVMPAVGGGK
ncbi:MAG: hypothetical protein NT003_00780 [Candidatus Magasanikbacteria bacterium]|nr:hypothetical protein [Candidatus Magasanikbacteria bacterium]